MKKFLLSLFLACTAFNLFAFQPGNHEKEVAIAALKATVFVDNTNFKFVEKKIQNGNNQYVFQNTEDNSVNYAVSVIKDDIKIDMTTKENWTVIPMYETLKYHIKKDIVTIQVKYPSTKLINKVYKMQDIHKMLN